MPFNATAEIEINKPLGIVIRFVFEPTNEPFWITGVLESHILSVRPIGRGTQVQRIQKFAGRSIEYVYEIVEFKAAGYMKLLSLNSPVNFEVEYNFKKIADDKTAFHQTLKGGYAGYLKVFDFLAARLVNGNLKRDMMHLKEILEK